jgi:RNA polymerase sigma-70 factor (ECF subfamily)
MTTTTDVRKRPSRDFTETHWSLVRAASDGGSPTAAAAALEQLCERYWSPIYVYLRQRGHTEHDAQDITQGFFERIIEDKTFASATPAKGRFRYYLIGALHHFMINEWHKAQASKRGGRFTIVSFDEAETKYSEVPASDLTPERAYDMRWRMTLLEQGLNRLHVKIKENGKEQQFVLLKPFLTAAFDQEARDRVARALNISLNAADVAVHRFRQEFRKAVRAELAETVTSQAEFHEELRDLFGDGPNAS